VVAPRLECYIGKTILYVERKTYQNLLLEFKDAVAWSNANLTGISPQYGEHRIDLKDASIPVRQRQYLLNPKYSLKVKDEINKLAVIHKVDGQVQEGGLLCNFCN
jgi:hypothetical protein